MTKTHNAKQLKKLIEETFDVKIDTSTRRREIVDLRRVFSIICVEYYLLTHQKTGELMNKDHSSVTHHIKTGNALLKFDSVFRKLFSEIKSKAPNPDDIEIQKAYHRAEINYHRRELERLKKEGSK